MNKLLINLLLFQTGWFVCVLGGNHYALVYTPLALFVHGWLVADGIGEWKLIAVIAVVGSFWDSLMAQTGMINYPDPLLPGIPLWLICLWCLFATTFMHSLFWLRKNLWLAAVVAAIAGPFNYWVGANLAAANLHDSIYLSLGVMAVGWGVLFPAGLFCAGKLKQVNTARVNLL